MKCKISDWGCVYHACMSDDCQRRFMILDNDFGAGKCGKKTISKPKNKEKTNGKTSNSQ